MSYNYNNGYGVQSCLPTYSANTLAYWERSLFQRMRTLFKIDGLPEGGANQVQTDKDAFLYGLTMRGFLVMLNTKKYGITFQPGTPYGIGLQFQPVGMNVATPYFDLYGLTMRGFLVMLNTKKYGITFQPGTPYGIGLQFQPVGMNVATPYFDFQRPLIIGRECEVLKLTPDYTGIWDIVTKYANELLLTEVAIRQSQYNARFAYAIAASDDKSAASIKALMERMTNGDPYVIYNRNLKQKGNPNSEPTLPWAQFDRDLTKNFILPELLEVRRTIITDFYREMGVPVPQDKKERVNALESKTNMMEFFNRRQVWMECLTESIDRCNRMFGTDISVDFICYL